LTIIKLEGGLCTGMRHDETIGSTTRIRRDPGASSVIVNVKVINEFFFTVEFLPQSGQQQGTLRQFRSEYTNDYIPIAGDNSGNGLLWDGQAMGVDWCQFEMFPVEKSQGCSYNACNSSNFYSLSVPAIAR
jgi:hypothetical protein